MLAASHLELLLLIFPSGIPALPVVAALDLQIAATRDRDTAYSPGSFMSLKLPSKFIFPLPLCHLSPNRILKFRDPESPVVLSRPMWSSWQQVPVSGLASVGLFSFSVPGPPSPGLDVCLGHPSGIPAPQSLGLCRRQVGEPCEAGAGVLAQRVMLGRTGPQIPNLSACCATFS